MRIAGSPQACLKGQEMVKQVLAGMSVLAGSPGSAIITGTSAAGPSTRSDESISFDIPADLVARILVDGWVTSITAKTGVRVVVNRHSSGAQLQFIGTPEKVIEAESIAEEAVRRAGAMAAAGEPLPAGPQVVLPPPPPDALPSVPSWMATESINTMPVTHVPSWMSGGASSSAPARPSMASSSHGTFSMPARPSLTSLAMGIPSEMPVRPSVAAQQTALAATAATGTAPSWQLPIFQPMMLAPPLAPLSLPPPRPPPPPATPPAPPSTPPPNAAAPKGA